MDVLLYNHFCSIEEIITRTNGQFLHWKERQLYACSHSFIRSFIHSFAYFIHNSTFIFIHTIWSRQVRMCVECESVRERLMVHGEHTHTHTFLHCESGQWNWTAFKHIGFSMLSVGSVSFSFTSSSSSVQFENCFITSKNDKFPIYENKMKQSLNVGLLQQQQQQRQQQQHIPNINYNFTTHWSWIRMQCMCDFFI